MNKQQIEKSIQEIKRRYRIGKDILEKCGPRSSSGQILKFAEKHSIGRDMCQKLRAMASTKTGYTETELDSLFQQFRTARHALSISHFVKLISVPKGSKRNRLTQQAIKQQWSSHQLQAEILAIQGRRKQGGRRPNLVSVEQVESQLRQQMVVAEMARSSPTDNRESRPSALQGSPSTPTKDGGCR